MGLTGDSSTYRSSRRLEDGDPYPPDSGELTFDFTGDEPHRLLVVHDGLPVDGATVDIVEAAPTLLADLPQIGMRHHADLHLDRVQTDGGRVELLGDPEALYIAYVYRDGFEPARVGLRAGAEVRVELEKRDVSVEFTGLKVGEQLRLREAGRDSLVAVHSAVDAAPVVVALAPGAYDATVEAKDGIVLRGATLNVTEPHKVDLAVDRRARVLLAPPEPRVPPTPYSSSRGSDAGARMPDRWIAWASRRTPAWSTIDVAPLSGLMRLADGQSAVASSTRPSIPPDVGRDGHRERLELRLPGSGRWMVHVGFERRPADLFFFTEVEIPANGTMQLELPTPNASLSAPLPYAIDSEDHRGAVDIPRVMLISATGTGWNAVGCFPKREAPEDPARYDCLFDRLPPGDYHVFHHLVDGTVWGGVEVSLRAGERTRLAGLGADGTATWTVEVVDDEGRPVTDRLLRIRDRWSEASSALDPPTRTASNAVPAPPFRRLRGHPVTFESIRAGWLELIVDDPAGSAMHYRRKAEPGKALRLVVGSQDNATTGAGPMSR